ncbi:biopolymer transporter ExbD [Comamonas sp. w2-DMI]|uniref:ExbD/TolR family protein n=1 Tax=Comamonas terrae TaxID=673548 RepID=A0ABW5USB7_9BURK|nr:biopolymer transporter ExbD [Comamonas terrae]
MPSVASRGGRNRRTVNEINMVPFIDVMLVLLIIFMVTAPMLTPGSINVPTAGKSSRPPSKNIAYVLLDKNGDIRLRTGSQEQKLGLEDLKAAAQSWQQGQPEESAMQIQADKNLTFEAVMKVRSVLQDAGVKRVAFGVVTSSH